MNLRRCIKGERRRTDKKGNLWLQGEDEPLKISFRSPATHRVKIRQRSGLVLISWRAGGEKGFAFLIISQQQVKWRQIDLNGPAPQTNRLQKNRIMPAPNRHGNRTILVPHMNVCGSSNEIPQLHANREILVSSDSRQ
ncbi:hypothetical protein AVEN_176771-1 [Araneus ventricosus]|uniref:Uncharacterized protein n=1 Tax=Araneus ventricosus TaxID=182803 RepID=A0A4Y2LHG5_ARAVE|nr:hypothetical protein AVEN_176771-1 [Araneus ventricosus]